MRKFHSEYGIEEFQRGRIHERERIAAWLRAKGPGYLCLAEAIHEGEHYDDSLPPSWAPGKDPNST